MYEILYTSTACKDLSDSELLKLLEKVRLKNKNNNITGMLLYDKREFVQLLEGEESVLRKLYSLIEIDSRHNDVEILYEGNISSRSFSSWSMAFQTLDDNDKSRLVPGYEPLKSKKSLRTMIMDNPNIGKTLFLSLRVQLKDGLD